MGITSNNMFTISEKLEHQITFSPSQLPQTLYLYNHSNDKS